MNGISNHKKRTCLETTKNTRFESISTIESQTNAKRVVCMKFNTMKTIYNSFLFLKPTANTNHKHNTRLRAKKNRNNKKCNEMNAERERKKERNEGKENIKYCKKVKQSKKNQIKVHHACTTHCKRKKVTCSRIILFERDVKITNEKNVRLFSFSLEARKLQQ